MRSLKNLTEETATNIIKERKIDFFGLGNGNRMATGELCNRVDEEIQQIDGELIIFSLVYVSRISMEELKCSSYKGGQ